jgi:tripartite ATP-independent transporter DctM subunit
MNSLVWIPIVILAIAFILKMPIAYGMLIGTFVYFIAAGQSVGSVIHLLVNAMMNNYVLLSVPLFIFTANIMNSSAVTEKIYAFANGLFGRFRGGTAYVNVIGSLIFAGMTGSSVADATGIGAMEIAQMKREKYDEGFSCALTATTAVLGPTFPPSIILVIYSTLSGASVGKLFMAGIVPSFVLSLMMCIYIAIIAKKREFPYGQRQTGIEFFRSTVKAIPALLTPVILLGGIYTGVMTPTEAGAVAALYAIIISFLVYRSINGKALWDILKSTAKTTGSVGLIVMAAYGFSHIVAAEHIPEIIGNFVVQLTDNKYLFYLLINVVLLFLGSFFDSNTIQLVFLPTVLAAAFSLGIDPVHFGVITSMNILIGQCTPPFGVLLFITSGISGTPLKKIIKEALPLVAVEIIVLLILTYIPDLVMFLPNTFM